MRYVKERQILFGNDRPLLESVPDAIRTVNDDTGCGVFLHAEGADASFWSVPLGTPAEMDRFTACYRGESTFWMDPVVGDDVAAVPPETQWLLFRRNTGEYVLLVPLVDGALRFCLAGGDRGLILWADSGDRTVRRRAGIGAYLAAGDDPYRLLADGAAAVQNRLKLGRLRSEKPLPDFVDSFGWCTWNAFYREVSADKVRLGLKAFREAGVLPKFLILDDGWQSTRETEAGTRLAAFAANETFPGGLAPLVSGLKQDFGLDRILVWHAVMGYWGGVDPERLPGYGTRLQRRVSPPTFVEDLVERSAWMGKTCGVIPPERIADFYHDYHAFLAREGVDGVKVDNQSSLEFSTDGFGGRGTVSLAYRRALEASCRQHFDGRLINCMSNANEMHVMARDSTLMRTSNDFWPDLPDSHGLHLYTNALVSLWFGQFVHPDWDMFVSGHPRGAYHAAARAISGGPVYVADAPGQVDADVLRRLVGTDGRVFRCRDIARPCPDSLMRDPTREPAPLKIFNRNAHGAVIGAFHARAGAGAEAPVSAEIALADVPGESIAGNVAVWAHRAETLRRLGPEETFRIRLEPEAWEVFTLAPMEEGLGVVGLADKYNSGGTIAEAPRRVSGGVAFELLDGGRLVLAAERRPRALEFEGAELPFDFDVSTGKVTASVPAAGSVTVRMP